MSYVCPGEECNALYSNVSDLAAHLGQLHCQYLPFECLLCGKCLPTEQRFFEHQQLKHASDKNSNSNPKLNHDKRKFEEFIHLLMLVLKNPDEVSHSKSEESRNGSVKQEQADAECSPQSQSAMQCEMTGPSSRSTTSEVHLGNTPISYFSTNTAAALNTNQNSGSPSAAAAYFDGRRSIEYAGIEMDGPSLESCVDYDNRTVSMDSNFRSAAPIESYEQQPSDSNLNFHQHDYIQPHFSSDVNEDSRICESIQTVRTLVSDRAAISTSIPIHQPMNSDFDQSINSINSLFNHESINQSAFGSASIDYSNINTNTGQVLIPSSQTPTRSKRIKKRRKLNGAKDVLGNNNLMLSSNQKRRFCNKSRSLGQVKKDAGSGSVAVGRARVSGGCSYVCNICHKTYASKSNIMRHYMFGHCPSLKGTVLYNVPREFVEPEQVVLTNNPADDDNVEKYEQNDANNESPSF